jgi:small conductance mechanosensitive channel
MRPIVGVISSTAWHTILPHAVLAVRAFKLFPQVYCNVEKPDFDDLTWLEGAAQQVLLVLLITAALIYLLHQGTKRLVKLSHTQELISGRRALQLRTVAGVLNSMGAFVVVFMASMWILPAFCLDIKPLLASAGVVGLAIGFGAQTLVKDMLNGFFILVENQYNVGDVIQVAGVSGTVEDMTLRRTVLRDADGTVHTVPNSEIKIVSNKTRDWSRVLLHVAAAYDESSERVIQLLREAADEVRNDPAFANMIVAEPEVPGIERVTGQEVDYLMQVKTLPGAPQYAVSRELRRRIKETFEKNKIKAAGPAKVYVFDRGQQSGGEQDTQ